MKTIIVALLIATPALAQEPVEPRPPLPALPTEAPAPPPAKTTEQIAAERWASDVLELEARRERERKERERAAAAAAAAPVAPRAPEVAAPALASEISAGGAFWRSAFVPGLGQIKSGRRVRGYVFLGATLASLATAAVLTGRAAQANSIYEGAPRTVRAEAYDQARSYAASRNAFWGLTALLWGANAAEAYFLHGTRDQ